ncbi:cytochrome C [candidate division KSB1 bacterium 4484_188]|nr:MAG: cytochrome C [candidate division KSB1 bacterium 4484_188]
MDTIKAQQWLIGIFSALLIVILIIVAGVEMKKSRSYKPEIEIDKMTKKCITCHEKKGIAVSQIDAWKESQHAVMGIGCYECHEAKKGDFDAFTCSESDILVARHPTPKDCARCHKQEVTEFSESKHAHQFWLLKNADRAVFENPISTRHGCEQCHAIGNIWPDGSVGECDVCHAKHSFSKAVARQPETCGECHMGPDHPHIEIYNESKHGNIFKAKGKNWDMSYSTKDHEKIPIEVPVCTTCHMDGNDTQPMTHNVSARLAWESQMTWSFRTVWNESKLGNWQTKRERMESTCKNCHAPDFVEMYLLTADLVNLQYNEIRREFVRWTKKLTNEGIIDRLKADGKFYSNPVLNGFDELPEHNMYYAWHHEGRRYRHGAEMMGADYTQWHGIWEIQEDLVELITWAAEHGDAEAKKWVDSNHPSKFATFALYDVPGNEWNIGVKTNTTPFLYNNYPDYWERIYQNVEAAYQHGLLSEKQWNLWLKRYKNKDYYLGLKFKADSTWNYYKERNDYDFKKMKEQVIDLILPGKPFYKK